MATISSADPTRSAGLYAQYLGYEIVERGRVDPELAALWGASAAGGRSYVLLRAPGPDASYIRFVETRVPPGYRALTTSGWNAIELLTQDPYALHARLENSPFKHLGGPAALSPDSSIHAVQYLGPDNEVLYFTADLGDEETSTLARSPAPVGRIFIVVLANKAIEPVTNYYHQRFNMNEALRMTLPIGLLARAQGRPLDQPYTLSLLRLAAFSHALEIDAYPEAARRPALKDELPPGIAVVSFCSSPESGAIRATQPGLQIGYRPYDGAPVLVEKGAAGELLELIHCPGPMRSANAASGKNLH
jgi:hypothetical protein